MVRGTFSPARAWRPAVVARLARTLGIRNTTVQCSSRKCACRRELNSHDAAKLLVAAWHYTVGTEGQSPLERKQPDFSRGRRERRPVQTHEEAARGGNWKQHPASIRRGGDRMTERRSQPRSGFESICKLSKLRVQGRGPRCKAQSAMQSPWQAPQTRSTATALAVARSRQQNPSHENAALSTRRAH